MKKTSFYVLIPTILTAFFAFCGVSFAFPNQNIQFYNDGEPKVSLTGQGITYFRLQHTTDSGGGESGGSISTTFNANTLIKSIYGDDGNSTTTISYWTCNINSPPFCDIGYSARYNHTAPEEIAYGTFIKVNNIGQGDPNIPPNYDTRIISVSPESNVNIVPFTQSSTTKYAPFDIDLLEYYNNVSTSTIAYITTTLSNKDIPTFTYTKTVLDVATGTATTSYSIYNQVPFGLYDYTIRLFDSNLDVIDSTTTTNIQFGSTTLPSITFEDIYGATSTQVFTATEQSVIAYINLINLLKTKAPFGYFYIVKNSLANLNTTSTSTVNIVIPAHLKTYFFSPIDFGIAGILWFYFIIFFYKRLKHITI